MITGAVNVPALKVYRKIFDGTSRYSEKHKKGTAECHGADLGADKISLIYVFLQTAALLPATYPLDHAHCRL